MRIHSAAHTAQAIAPVYSLRLRKHGAVLADTVALWKERKRYRADLRRLSRVGPYMLHDIGLTPEEANREIHKPFWKP
ncbi:MAG: DUF1127 domain-containing protein [Gammaproteobacteria bacterium]|nr:DUF1127 domain-containing protein [Gammaproteobacteria bacterium]